MTIEEKIFGYKRFDAGAMLEYGFAVTDKGYEYSADIMNGDFHVLITVSHDGRLTASVEDMMNGEEYAALRMEDFCGAYVSSVRAAYEELLCKIADSCCRDVPFACSQSERIAGLIFEKYAVCPDFPWDGGAYKSGAVFRHKDSGKWFALIMNVRRSVLIKNGGSDTVDIINLKADPADREAASVSEGIYPAYHMNHKQWISALLDGSLTDDELMTLVERSFILTDRGAAKKRRSVDNR